MLTADWRWRRMWFYLNWEELKGRVQRRWPELTEDDLSAIEGRRETLIKVIESRYGRTRSATELEVDGWLEGRWRARFIGQDTYGVTTPQHG